MRNTLRFYDKTALVTGAALGYKDGGPSIGSAIAIKMAREGACVVVVDINEEMGERTVEEIICHGGAGLFVKADTSRMEDVERAIQATKNEFGSLSYLVNCAASYEGDIFHTVVDTNEDDWLNVFNVNLHGYYRFAKAAIPLMLRRGGGAIVNISSMAAFNIVPNFAVYPVTKAAINALTRVIAIDHAPSIRANAICPGYVKIANSEGNRSPEELQKRYASIAEGYPAKRLCNVDEIADVACFLASDESSYINGQSICVDSGRSISDSFDYGP